MAISGPNLKSFETRDFTSNGKDVSGCFAAVAFGALAGGATGMLAADKLSCPTDAARLWVGATTGGLVAGLVAGGASAANPRLALAGILVGILAGALGASNLSPLLDGSEERRRKPGPKPPRKESSPAEEGPREASQLLAATPPEDEVQSAP
mmetsp:Transcript_48805/g.79238  ORF Transcript_48805/g.79238 Transcript_48805/m.79238 type:complete len:152 (+) Transcript_48805:65-520(+)